MGQPRGQPARHRGPAAYGLGRELLTRAAGQVVDGAQSPALYLWVLEQNAPAQAFYAAMGAAHVETLLVGAPAGDPTRLNGTPAKFRMSWPDAAALRDA